VGMPKGSAGLEERRAPFQPSLRGVELVVRDSVFRPASIVARQGAAPYRAIVTDMSTDECSVGWPLRWDSGPTRAAPARADVQFLRVQGTARLQGTASA
jgi:hypothetical protein